jgi:TPR repeat protein
MPDSPADLLYAEGMKYDFKQDQSPAAATLARASFQQAATMGHGKALRALAHLTYEGRGGPQDHEQALLLLWSAFNRGDHEALEELGDMLGTYAEAATDPSRTREATFASENIEELNRLLGQVSSYMQELVREREAGKGVSRERVKRERGQFFTL